MVEAEQAATDSGNGTGVRALFGVARSHLIYWQRKPSAWLVVVPVFLYVFASSLSVSPLSQFIIVRVCRALGPELGSIPTGAEEKYMHFLADPEYSQCVVRADVQAAAALLSQLLGIAFDTPALLLVPVMGSLVDTRGRRSMLACPVLAALLFALAIAAVHQFELTLWTLVPARLFCGCLGGFPLLTLAANAFVADTTPPDRRTHAFLLIDTTVFVGFSLGPLCGGLLYRTAGILPVVALVVVSCLSVLLYLAFVLPETVSSASLLLHSRSQPISTSSPIRYIGITFVRSWTKAFDVLATPEHASSLVVLAITAACNNIGSAGYQFAFYFYPSQRFAWDAYDFGLYSMAKSFCRMFYLSVLMPFLLRTFVTGRERIQKTRAEITIIR
ncbi:major facilitator superfamily domain-containing protein [Chytriomyces sp. MP71]|nr:major facilitator superfamily domain-containing protein [Chytriomyces sp. MP71]